MRTQYIEHEFELDEFLGRFFATVWIEVECDPGEPEVRYTKNGDGYPGSPATVCPIKATVTSLSGANWDKNRDELTTFLGPWWLARLDERALKAANEAVDCGRGWLADQLFDELEAIHEQY